jgi:hypothetical protein
MAKRIKTTFYPLKEIRMKLEKNAKKNKIGVSTYINMVLEKILK